MNQEFEDYIDLESNHLATDEFPKRLKEYISPEIDNEGTGLQKLKSQIGIKNKSPMHRAVNDENIFLNNQMYNLALLKNVLTSIYPNLQRPNIMKA